MRDDSNGANGFKNMNPFICHLIPFVCYKKTSILPLVGRNIPFVSNRGFNLVEVVIVLTIAGILTALAAPGMQNFFSSNRLTAQVNELLADLSLARSEGIKRSVDAGVCVTAAGGNSCVSSGNWANGWLVYYVCPSSDSSCTANSNVTLKIHEALTNNNTLTAPAVAIVFSKTGLISSGTGQFTLSDPKTGGKRYVCIGATGRPMLYQTDCPT